MAAFQSLSQPSGQVDSHPSSIPLSRLTGDDATRPLQVTDSKPNGGYGWVVVFGCSVITFWFVGTTYSWGVIQASLVAQGLTSTSTLSFVGSVTVALNALLALVSTRFIRIFGARTTGMLGITLLSAGEILSGFSTKNVGGLFFTTGVIMGIGVSFCFMVTSVTPAQYFSTKLGLANGIVYAGGGIGGSVISFAMNGLLSRLDPAWTFRIIGLVTLGTGLPAAWLVKERAPIRSNIFIEWRLFSNPTFLLIFTAGAIATFTLFVPPFFLPLYAHSLSLSSSVGAGLVAAFTFSSAIGRLGCGYLCDIIGPLNSLFLALLFSAISMLTIWPASTTLAPLIVFTVVNGIANGGFFSTMPTVIGAMFGHARIGVVMGMVVTGWFGGYLMGAPVAGYLLQAYGGEDSGLSAYHPAIFFAGSMATAAAGLVLMMRLMLEGRVFRKV
ncbi:hypothetical protein AJ80_04589 [Polytolypa hystricis UAMH7299]|uniref:Major facilitator superfamily (MFS) profile domain-containing protein n=1 Tax=Polytolypa hystricis (strain UAMH7299) TaxID=1447883 RepID=A0A2B7YAM2_POLH7|nr:hypothetical protein AJ80_04589 [Polytolypa hystricis UAMH7299]